MKGENPVASLVNLRLGHLVRFWAEFLKSLQTLQGCPVFSAIYELGGRVAKITNDSHLPLSISGVEPYMRVTCTNQVPSSALPTFCCSSLHCSRVRRHMCGLPASTPGQPSVKCSALKPPNPGTISARALFAADSARRGMTIHSAIGSVDCASCASSAGTISQPEWVPCSGIGSAMAAAIGLL